MVSPGACGNYVIPFFSSKKVMTILVIVTIPTLSAFQLSNRLSSVLCKFSRKK